MAVTAIGSSAYVTPTNVGVDLPTAVVMHSNTDGFSFQNTGIETILLTTTAAVPDRKVTIVTSATLGGFSVADQVIALAGASEDKLVGPFPTALFGTTVLVKPSSEADSAANGIGIRIIKFN